MANVSINRFEWVKAVLQTGLTPAAKNTATALGLQFANDETRQINPSTTTLVKYLRVSKSTIKRTLNELIDAGWLDRTEGRGAGNMTAYTLLSPGKILPFNSQKRVQKCPQKKGSQVSLSHGKKGSPANQKGVTSEPSYIEQSFEQNNASPFADQIISDFKRFRFDGNSFDGLTLVSKDDWSDLNRWSSWLTAHQFPGLHNFPIKKLGQGGTEYFLLPWRRPRESERGTEQAVNYFRSFQFEEGFRHAAE